MKSFLVKKCFGFWAGVICLTTMSALKAQDEVYLKIKSGGFGRIPVYVSVFQSDSRSETSESLRQVLINDLRLSGYLTVFDKLMMTFNKTESAEPQASPGARIDGDLEFHSNNLTLTISLFELPSERKIIDKKYKATVTGWRWLAHQAADEIVFNLVGEPGIASTRIVFVTETGRGKELALVDYDGHGMRKLTLNNSLNLSPKWSPDGEKIAFTSYVNNNPDLFVYRAKEAKALKLSNQRGLNSAPAWSPDGKKLAFTMSVDGNAELYAVDSRGGKPRRLTSHPAIDSSPSWSPNGRQIVFTSDRSGSPQLYLMDAEGGNVRRLTFQGNYNDSPAWNPRGDQIAFVSRSENQFHIFTIDINGENLARITQGPGSNENPSWSPDGLWLVFSSNRNGKWDLYIIRADGTDLRQLTLNGGNISPSWSPRLKN